MHTLPDRLRVSASGTPRQLGSGARPDGRGGREVGGRRPWQCWVPASLTAGLVLMPKCPICLMAGLGLVGIGIEGGGGWMLATTAVSFALVAAVLAAGAVRRRSCGPFLVGLVALVAIAWGKYRAGSNAGVVAGLVLLVAAVVWNGRSRGSRLGRCLGECQASCAERDPVAGLARTASEPRQLLTPAAAMQDARVGL